jgi:hypothetical protein
MDVIELGAKARLIVENDAFEFVFDSVRQSYQDAWSKTGPEDGHLRGKLYSSVVALEDVKRALHKFATAGKNEELLKEKENE